MDMMSDFENMDVILANDNINPIKRELSNVIGNSENHWDTESKPQFRENTSQGNRIGYYVHENILPGQHRFQEPMETFISEFNTRLSPEMDSMMSKMHTQINRAISSAVAVRVIPEIQNIVSFMSSSGNRDTESGLFPKSQRVREDTNAFESKFTNSYFFFENRP